MKTEYIVLAFIAYLFFNKTQKKDLNKDKQTPQPQTVEGLIKTTKRKILTDLKIKGVEELERLFDGKKKTN